MTIRSYLLEALLFWNYCRSDKILLLYTHFERL